MDWSNLKNKSKDLLKNFERNDTSHVGNGRDWLISILTKAIEAVSTEQDRLDILAWLALVRETLVTESLSKAEKAKHIYAISDSKKTAGIVLRSLSTSARNYKKSDLPLSVKVAIPATLAAAAIVGGQGVGLAAFGSAIGLPVLLLVFLGAAGITSVLEAFINSKDARSYIGVVMNLIVRDEIYRHANQAMQRAMTDSPAEPKSASMPDDDTALQAALMALDPYDFERHVMSFFQQQGLMAWVTKKSNDAGVDGFAKHEQGLVVVQCKRYANHNLVGRPAVQQFKGVIEENQAWRGYVVTSSGFTQEAKDSAALNERLVLIDMVELLKWHKEGKVIL